MEFTWVMKTKRTDPIANIIVEVTDACACDSFVGHDVTILALFLDYT